MSLIVSSIVGGINEQNSIVKNVCADDWTAKCAIIASDESYTVAIQVITGVYSTRILFNSWPSKLTQTGRKYIYSLSQYNFIE